MDCIWKNIPLQFYWESACITGDLDTIQMFLQHLKQSGFEDQSIENCLLISSLLTP